MVKTNVEKPIDRSIAVNFSSFLSAGVPSDYSIQVNSGSTIYSNEFIESKYIYEMNHCEIDHTNKQVNIVPRKYQYNFRTKRQVQRTGVMLVGWGGNNGTTFTGAIIANRDQITWMRKGTVKRQAKEKEQR